MIITDTVKIKMEGKSFKIYRDKGYIFNWRDIIDIKIKDLLHKSNALVVVKCVCGKINEISYKSYNKNINTGGYYSCHSCSSDKRKKTCLDRYGVNNYSKTGECREKMKDTCLEKYGVDSYSKTKDFLNRYERTCLEKYGGHYNKSDEYKNRQDDILKITKKTKIKNGVQLPDNLIEPFKLYKRKCRNLTNRNRKLLFEKWDGYDYYDSEFILENLLLKYNSNLYPTIDHKISIWYGFHNNITIEEISHKDNLCITKRIINSKKRTKNENEYRET